MAILTAILTHLDAARVTRQLEYLEALSPGSRFLVCHGGAREEYERLEADAVFLEEPSLRAEPMNQSYTSVLRTIWDGRVRDDPGIDLLYFIEFDHLVLRPDFEGLLREHAGRTGAGLLAKRVFTANDTNWDHFLRYRDDGRVNGFFAEISRREDPGRRLGCLGTGMLLRRDALEAFCSVPDPPHAFMELFVPSVIHHLGFEVADFDRLSDIYAAVRWRPEFAVAEAVAAKRAGRAFVHPFKRLDALDEVAAA